MLPIIMVDLQALHPISGLQPYPLMFILLEMMLHATSSRKGEGMVTLRCLHMLACSLLPALTQLEAGTAAARVSEWVAAAPGAGAASQTTAAAGAQAAGEPAAAAPPQEAAAGAAGDLTAAAAEQQAGVRVASGTSAPAGKEEGEGKTEGVSSSASEGVAAEALVADPRGGPQEAPLVSSLTGPAPHSTQAAGAFTGTDALLPLLGAVVACRKQ